MTTSSISLVPLSLWMEEHECLPGIFCGGEIAPGEPVG